MERTTNIVPGLATLAFLVVLAFLVNRQQADRRLIDLQRTRIAQLEQAVAKHRPTPPLPPPQAVPAGVSELTDSSAGPTSARRIAPVRFNAGGSNGGGRTVLTGPLSPPLMPHPGGLDSPAQHQLAVQRERFRVDRDLRDFRFWPDMDEGRMQALTDRVTTYLVDGMSEGEQLVGADGSSGREAMAARERQLEVDLTGLLGEEGVRRLREYRRTETARMQLAALNQRLPASDALTPTQIRPLSVAMTRASGSVWLGQGLPRGVDRSDPRVQVAMMDDRLERFRRAADQEYAAAASYLSARQLAALRELQQLKLEEVRAADATERMMLELVP